MTKYDDGCVHFSRLKLIARSPAHYQLGQPPPSKAMELGTAVDQLYFGTRPVIWYPGATRRGKDWDAFQSSHPGETILTATTYDIACHMVASLRASADASELLAGEHQQRIEWTRNGRKCAGIPDVVNARGIVDLKTTQDSNPEKFRWQALKLAYPAQLDWYRIGLGKPDVPCYIVAVESRAPYNVTCLQVAEPLLQQGRQMASLWLERLIACEAAGDWPGYVQSIVTLDVPEATDVPLDFGDEGDEGAAQSIVTLDVP